MWIRGDHDMTLSSTRTSAAREEEERGGSGGDRAGRERKGGRVGSQGWQTDRHAKTTDTNRERETESQESGSHKLGSGFDLCLCPSRRSFHVDPAPYNGMYTLHTA